MNITQIRNVLGPLLAITMISGIAAGADRTGALAHLAAAAVTQTQPTITILPAATGASLQSNINGNASLSLGRAAYYGGSLPSGVVEQRKTASMVLSTRFGLKVDCGSGSPSSSAEVTISLAAIDPSYSVRVDGVTLLAAPSVTLLQCGSVTQHMVEVDVPKSKPAGNLASTLVFSAAPKY